MKHSNHDVTEMSELLGVGKRIQRSRRRLQGWTPTPRSCRVYRICARCGERNHVRRLFCTKCFMSRAKVPYSCHRGAPGAHPTPAKPSHDSGQRTLSAETTHALDTCCPSATPGTPAPTTSDYHDALADASALRLTSSLVEKNQSHI